jgi:inosine-uridine nucleoside N-ribohydrolase
MTSRRPILLDCDPGIDDVLAILAAAHHADLIGVTTVNGNVGIEHTTTNALLTAQIAGLRVPVHRGADRPLVEPVLDAARMHGTAGLGTVDPPELELSVASDDAVGFICDAARSVDGLELVAVGPLTNIALALRRDPLLPSLISGLTIMGGAARTGNVTAAAEFNIWADPEAAAIVFREAAPVTMVGLDLTLQVVLGDTEAQRVRASGTPASTFAADLLDFYIDRSRSLGLAGASIHDACAVLVVTHPHLFTRQLHPIEVELTGRYTRGMTVIDQRPWHGSDPSEASVVWAADSAAVIELIVEAATAF